MIDQFAKAVQKGLRKDMNDLADALASGRCKSFDEYRYTCGVLRGLYTAEEYLMDLAKKVEEAE